jgi:anti-anti-sigma factor
MSAHQLSLTVRKPNARIAIVDIAGEFTGDAETRLMDAYEQAEGVKALILNFDGMDYMNSSGIGLLITLMIRINRNKQKLFVYGLKEHYRQIFKLTRLDEAVVIYNNEAEAVAAAQEL